MYNHNKAQQSKNRVHISWDKLYLPQLTSPVNIILQTDDEIVIKPDSPANVLWKRLVDNNSNLKYM